MELSSKSEAYRNCKTNSGEIVLSPGVIKHRKKCISEKSEFKCFDIIDKHKCSMCIFETYFLVDLKEHINNGHRAKRFRVQLLHKCENCAFETFSQLLSLRHKEQCLVKYEGKRENDYPVQSSKKSGFDKYIRFQCDHCSYTTNYTSSFDKHVLLKHSATDKINKWFSCERCRFKSKQKSVLQDHIKLYHTRRRRLKKKNKEPRWFYCEFCPYKVTQKTNLRRHFLCKHTPSEEIKWFQCEHCSFKAKEKGNLRRHISFVHTALDRIKWFQCQVCPFKTKQNVSLQRHIMLRHTPSDEISWKKCEHCFYTTKDKRLLLRHLMVNHNIGDKMERLRCEYCAYETKVKARFEQHVKVHHPPNKQQLGYKTTKKYSYRYSPVDKAQWFKCGDCPSEFKRMANLERHRKICHMAPEKIERFQIDHNYAKRNDMSF